MGHLTKNYNRSSQTSQTSLQSPRRERVKECEWWSQKAYSQLSDVTLRRQYDSRMGFRDAENFDKPYSKPKSDKDDIIWSNQLYVFNNLKKNLRKLRYIYQHKFGLFRIDVTILNSYLYRKIKILIILINIIHCMFEESI